jgi:hypothetical protein
VEDIVVSVAVLTAMFIGMRLIYGYWPWQLHPLLRVRRTVREPPTGYDFQPVPKAAGVVRNGADHFDRSYVGNDNGEAKQEQLQHGEPQGVADPKKDEGGQTPTS